MISTTELSNCHVRFHIKKQYENQITSENHWGDRLKRKRNFKPFEFSLLLLEGTGDDGTVGGVARDGGLRLQGMKFL